MTKLWEQQEARRLRALGWSLRAIAVELKVSLSSASVWVRDVQKPFPTDPVPETTDEQALPEATALKRCGKCRQRLPLLSFNRRGAGRQGWCRECFRHYFQARGSLHREQSSAAKARRKRQAQQFVRAHLSTHPCVDCRETDLSVLEFDHIGPKRGDVSALAAGGLSLGALRDEIESCEVVCANCHRRRTAMRGRSWRVRPEEIEHRRSHLGTRSRNRAYVRDVLLQSECIDCGISDLLVLEFDHVEVKEANVSDLVRSECGLARIQAEIDRCEVRCANCHRRRTTLLRRRNATKVRAGA